MVIIMKLCSNIYLSIYIVFANNVITSLSFRSNDETILRNKNVNDGTITWAQIASKNEDSNSKNINFYESRMLDYNKNQNNVYSGSNLPLARSWNNNIGPIYGYGRPTKDTTQTLSDMSSQDNPNKFQKRALDFIYHKFVEPKIHRHVEPRPSLFEELVSTFDSHVKQDLAAWNKASEQNTNKRETQQEPSIGTNDMEAHSSTTNIQIDPKLHGKNLINSVANVEEGEADDTFIVTDDSGKKHLITVDEIINSLSQMNENEINNLLVGSPIEPSIERTDSFHEYEGITDRSDVFPPTVSKDIQYSRKGVGGDNDIILIQSEDGDTRLVTVKDARLSEENRKRNTKNRNKVPKPKSIPTISGKDNVINNFPLNQNLNSPINLKDLLNFHEQEISSNFPQSSTVNQQLSPSLILKQSDNHKRFQSKPNINIHEEIRQESEDLKYLLELKKNKDKSEQFVASPSAIIQGVTAPNSPPLKVINTEASIMDLLPFQSSVSIRSNTPPVIQKTGIRKRLSNFFSRLVGKPVTDVNISNQPGQDLDEFIQIVMPRSDSNTMEQITIPLPKAIHHKGRNIQVQKSTSQKSKNKRAERRSSTSSETTSSKNSKNKSSKNKSGVKSSENVAESILHRAKIPDMIKEKIIAQLNDNPAFLPLTNQEETHGQIDRQDRFIQVRNKADPKEIQFPIGYTYDIPPEFQNYNPYPVEYGYHAPHYGHGGKGHKSSEESQPLLDINLLADLVLLSRDGDDNQSFSFPKIGDAAQFVDVRKINY